MSITAINDLLDQAPIEEAVSLVAVELINFLAMELPVRGSILSPWLPEAGLCMIHAYRGIGKTHISLGIAYAVAKGGKFLTWEASKPRNVLYIDGEMPASVLQERLANIIVMMGDEEIKGRLAIITPDLQKMGMPDLATKEGQEALNQYITDDIDLIIVDNLSCLAPSIKENDATNWAPIQTWVLSLRAKGKSVLLVHHSGKGGAQRGTSKKEDVLDTVIILKRPKDYESSQGARFIVEFEKARGFFGEDAKSFEAQLCNDENGNPCWTTQSIEESTFEKVVKMLKDGITQQEIADELDIHKSTVSRHVSKAKEAGLLKQQNGSGYE
ncbi:MarR family protein [Legionella steelei]|uniref:MarR family protein n=1 Tax=Legionella steelei TaxID=947033 RepID=A0A0W0ZI21_9GAMM|nr:AAA family ATPase [Legionella steelei]KTD68879.1 MarR family protein [Legionella steelei]